jgi:aminoglycoside N3'-acetyltransferase
MSALIYKGDGKQFFMGVPTRNLTEAEVKELPAEVVEKLVSSGVYASADEKVKKEVSNA